MDAPLTDERQRTPVHLVLTRQQRLEHLELKGQRAGLHDGSLDGLADLNGVAQPPAMGDQLLCLSLCPGEWLGVSLLR